MTFEDFKEEFEKLANDDGKVFEYINMKAAIDFAWMAFGRLQVRKEAKSLINDLKKYSYNDRFVDPFDLPDPDQLEFDFPNMNKLAKSPLKEPEEIKSKCDCGGEKLKLNHTEWCSTK